MAPAEEAEEQGQQPQLPDPDKWLARRRFVQALPPDQREIFLNEEEPKVVPNPNAPGNIGQAPKVAPASAPAPAPAAPTPAPAISDPDEWLAARRQQQAQKPSAFGPVAPDQPPPAPPVTPSVQPPAQPPAQKAPAVQPSFWDDTKSGWRGLATVLGLRETDVGPGRVRIDVGQQPPPAPPKPPPGPQLTAPQVQQPSAPKFPPPVGVPGPPILEQEPGREGPPILSIYSKTPPRDPNKPVFQGVNTRGKFLPVPPQPEYTGPGGRGLTLPPPTGGKTPAQELQEFLLSPPKGVEAALEEFDDIVGQGPMKLITQGLVAPGVRALTSPASLGLMAVSGGVGALAGSPTATVAAAGKAANAALSAYFATDSFLGAVRQSDEAAHALVSGDPWGALAHLGQAGTQGLFAYLAGMHAHGELSDLETIAATKRVLQERANAQEQERSSREAYEFSKRPKLPPPIGKLPPTGGSAEPSAETPPDEAQPPDTGRQGMRWGTAAAGVPGATYLPLEERGGGVPPKVDLSQAVKQEPPAAPPAAEPPGAPVVPPSVGAVEGEPAAGIGPESLTPEIREQMHAQFGPDGMSAEEIARESIREINETLRMLGRPLLGTKQMRAQAIKDAVMGWGDAKAPQEVAAPQAQAQAEEIPAPKVEVVSGGPKRPEEPDVTDGRKRVTLDPTKMDEETFAQYVRLRELLKNADNLGFDTTREATEAILLHQDWATRWDVAGHPGSDELVRLGNKFGGWEQGLPAPPQAALPPAVGQAPPPQPPQAQLPPQVGQQPPARGLDDVAGDIEAERRELKQKGVDTSPRLRQLYQEAEEIQRYEDEVLNKDLHERLRGVIPDDAVRRDFVREVGENTIFRGRPDPLFKMTKLANAAVDLAAAEHGQAGHPPNWLIATNTGTDETPQISLRVRRDQHTSPYPQGVIKRAQQILDAALGRNAPLIPDRPLSFNDVYLSTPTPKERPARAYDEVQRDIDAAEEEQERQGRSDYEVTPELERLYRERFGIEKWQDAELNAGVHERLAGVIPDEEQRQKLVVAITQTDRPVAIRYSKPTETIDDIGRVANEALQFAARESGESEERWSGIRAVLSGTPDDPGIQLQLQEPSVGTRPYSQKVLARAQEILDALMEGNAPQIPGGTPKAKPPVEVAPPAAPELPPAEEPQGSMFDMKDIIDPAKDKIIASRYADLAPHEIELDPVRFQFKQEGVGQKGVTDQFKDVTTWDPNLAGTVHVWRDPANGKIYAVNGHHRVELAQRLVREYGPGAVPEGLHVRFLDKPTAAEARAEGALINIAEGNGTPLDIAKYFRDSGKTPEMLEAGGAIKLNKRNSRLGAGLSKLAQSLFDDAIAGVLPLERGAIIGAGAPNHIDQRNIYDVLKARERAGRRMTDAQLQEMIRLNERGPTVTETSDQGDLWGADEIKRSLLPEKAEISDYVRKQLAAEKRLFGAVGTQAAAERLEQAGNVIKASENAEVAERASQVIYIYDQLSRSAGPIDQHLNEAAQEIADGQDPTEVKRRAYTAIREEVQRAAAKFAGRPQGPGVVPQNDGGPQSLRPRRRRGDGPGELFHGPGELAFEQPAGTPAERIAGTEVVRYPGAEGTAAIVTHMPDGSYASQLIDADDGTPLSPATIEPSRDAAVAHAQDLAKQRGLLVDKAAMRQLSELTGEMEAERERERLSRPQFGQPTKPGKLKPAKQSEMFSDEPEQGGLFALRRVPPDRLPVKRNLKTVQQMLHDRTQRRAIKDSAPDAVKLHRLVNESRKNLEEQLSRDSNGMNWYEDDTELSDQDIAQAFTELARNPRKLFIFKMISAAVSPGLNPKQESNQAAVIYAIYRKAGKLPVVRPGGKPWSGKGARVALRKLNRLAELMGEDGVAHFLTGLQDANTIRQIGAGLGATDQSINKWIGGRERMFGAAVLGPKVGRYFAGIAGLPEDGTAIDLWMSRMHYRHWGRLIGANGKAAGAPRTPADQKLMMRAHEVLAEEFGLTPKQVQSLLWHYEQELYRSLGATAKSYRRSEGTLKYLEDNKLAKAYIRDRRSIGTGERAALGAPGSEGGRAEPDVARAVPGSPEAAGREEGQKEVSSLRPEQGHDTTRADLRGAANRPHIISIDPEDILRLEDPPRPTKADSDPVPVQASARFFDGADAYVWKVGDVPALFINQPAMDLLLHARGMWSIDKNGTHIMGSVMRPAQWEPILRYELEAFGRVEQGQGQKRISDKPIIRLAGQLRDALGLPSLTDQLASLRATTGHGMMRELESQWAANRTRMLIVAQTGKSLTAEEVKAVIEEEYDHVQHMRLPAGGMNALPLHITEFSPIGREAAKSLEEIGYAPLAAPDHPERMGINAVLTSEILVRLMRPDRWRDMVNSPQKAMELAWDYRNALKMLGPQADAIINQIEHVISGLQETIARGDKVGSGATEEAGTPARPRGPPGAGEDVSRSQRQGPAGWTSTDYEPQALIPKVRKVAEVTARVAKGTKAGRALGIGPSVERVIIPGIDLWEKASNQLLAAMNPSGRPGAESTALSARAHMAHMDRIQKQASIALEEVRKTLGKLSQNQRWKFTIRAESNRPQMNATLPNGKIIPAAELDRIAAVFKNVNDKIRAEVENADDPSVVRIWRDVFWPNLWKETSNVAPGAPGSTQPGMPSGVRGRAPLSGSKSFTKKKVFDTFLDGVKKGYTPLFDNPVDYWQAKMREMTKFAMFTRLMRDIDPLAKFRGEMERMPPGYASVKDPFARVLQWSKTEKGFIARGEWVYPENAARILNNHLTPDPRQTVPIWKLISDLGNMWVRWKLAGFFHFGTTALNSVYSHAALAARMAADGNMKGAAKHLLAAPIAPVADLVRGSRLHREFLDLNGTQSAVFKALEEGGYRAGQDPYIASNMRKRLVEGWRAGERIMPIKLAGAAIDTIAIPIVDKYVPYLKMAAISDLARFELERYARRNGGMLPDPPRLRKIMADAVNSVDNRFGQLAYDNLFLNRSQKATFMSLIMSVGWNLGTFRELGGGMKDILGNVGAGYRTVKRGAARQFLRRVPLPTRGQPPRGIKQRLQQRANRVAAQPIDAPGMTNRIAYLAAMIAIHTLVAALYMKFMTGKNLSSVKDAVYPQDGGTDERGHPTRTSFPDYMKEMWNWANDPENSAINKTHPMLSLALKLINNRDYWGSKMQNFEDDKWERMKQLWDYALREELPPLFWNNLKKMSQRAGESIPEYLAEHSGKAVLSQIGFNPAPAMIGMTEAEKKVADFQRARQSVGGREVEEAQRTTARAAIMHAIRVGEDTQPAIDNAMRQGLIGGKDLAGIYKAAQLTPLQASLHKDQFSPGEVLRIWEVATPAERKQIEPLARQRLMRMSYSPNAHWPDWAREAAMKQFGITVRPRLTMPPGSLRLPPSVGARQ